MKKERKPTRDPLGSIIKKCELRRSITGRTKKVTVYYARVRWLDSEGQPKELKRKADDFKSAIELRRQLIDEMEELKG